MDLLPALVAPDSFKGTFTAADVAAAIARGLRDGGQPAVELPVADGGEGTLDALLAARGGELRTAPATDPLGRPVDAPFALLGDGSTAVVEVAAASGLTLLAEGERDAWAASSYGTGELIAAACDAGARTVVVGVGGSATTDGGEGAVAALRDAAVAPGELILVCDVRTPWELAPRVFGPQKGADAATVKRLEERLDDLRSKLRRDPRGQPMTGAAGGLAGGLWAEFGAKLVPGAPYVLDAVGFDAAMRGARFVVTGEGRIDEGTLQGKVVGEVATRARQAGVGCHAVVGQEALDLFGERVLDIGSVREAGTLDELAHAGRELAALLAPSARPRAQTGPR
jgi:glycerate kinase